MHQESLRGAVNLGALQWQASCVEVIVAGHLRLKRDRSVPSLNFRVFRSCGELTQTTAGTRQVGGVLENVKRKFSGPRPPQG